MKKFHLLIFPVLIVLSALILILKPFDRSGPNIILISIDTLRQDHVGAYGYEKNVTPEVDRIASEGVLFEHSYSTAPWTLPSHMSMFTALPPSVHGVDIMNTSLDSGKQVLTEVLKVKGYKTAGFYSGVYLKEVFGFSRGFDLYSNHIGDDSGLITDQAVEWIDRNKREKFFLFVHYFDAHYSYRPSVETAERAGIDTDEKRWFRFGKLQFLKRFSDPAVRMNDAVRKRVISLYDAEIIGVDRSIGRLIRSLKKTGMYDRTLIIITSDHGEEFDDHGSFGHYHQLYSELINVPLIIRYPRLIPGGSVIGEPVSSVDIAATVLNAAEIDVPHQFLMYGKDMLQGFRSTAGAGIKEDRVLISETRSNCSHHFAFIYHNHKYISPYCFRPLGEKNRWISVSEKLFDTLRDRPDHHDLTGKLPDGDFDHKILSSIRHRITGYAEENIPGVRLVFSPPEDKKGGLLEGSLDFGGQGDPIPFGVNFTEGDAIIFDGEGSSISYRIGMADEKKEIFIHMSTEMDSLRDFTVSLFSGTKTLMKAGIDVRKLSIPELIYKGSMGSIYIQKKGLSKKKKIPGLSDKDRALLKTLGYIN